jgi:hypothetical protein
VAARPSISTRSSRSSVTTARNSLTPVAPCAATMPSSDRCASKALLIWGALTYQHIAPAVLNQLTLLFGLLDPHEAHGRTPSRLADASALAASFLLRLT